MTTLTADPQGVGETRGLQPRALIVTTYGAFAREAGGWLSVSSLIRLMADLEVDEPAVRSSISRLKRRGILEAAKLNSSAGYALSERAREILAEGDRRIFQRPVSRLSDGWVLAVFSVPESERDRRHVLRSRLTWLGFGTAAPGVWIAPAHLYDEAREELERLELTSYVNLFRAEYLAFADIRACIDQWWNLEGLQRLYDEFRTSWQPVLARWRRRRSLDEGQAFADYIRALTHWRRLPFLDPGLPVELLPANWHGSRAADLFESLQLLLREPAHRHVRAITGR
ncbi:PaaX family transcriptional regulator [Micromonospora rhizosphaerae]|uniref:PaaX family transcriptional regulator n=1 Tax=Micromonospora rhizosphaerae TaxID=568872 RepID=UPI000B84F62A|nr:PaaX family transcriptional regulator C-terminal domain-containing protein [Micromonospora rhizosphaerae]